MSELDKRRIALFIQRVQYLLNRSDLERCIDDVLQREARPNLDGSAQQPDATSVGYLRDLLEDHR